MKETDGYIKALQHHAQQGCQDCAARLSKIDALTQHMRALPEGTPIVVSNVDEVRKGGKRVYLVKHGSGRTHSKHRDVRLDS